MRSLKPLTLALSLCAALTASAEVKEGKFDASKLPAGVTFQGKALSGLSWTDKNGDNYVVFSTVENQDKKTSAKSHYLYANHYAVKDGVAKSLRVVKDMNEKCDLDNVTRFLPASFQVTDLDKDDIAEVTFAYTVDCISDVSPYTLKLLVLEGGDKYILRGQTELEEAGTVYGGKFEADASFKKAPKTFLPHAEAAWKKIVRAGY